MLRSRDAIDGVGTRLLRGTIEIDGVLLPTDIDWKVAKNETTSFRLRRNSAASFDYIRQVFREGVPNIGVNLKFDYIPHRACLAVLRIAYLVMFRKLGYRYILSPAAGVIRETIARFEEPLEQLPFLVAELRTMSPPPDEPIQFLAVDERSAVLVIITLTADTKRHYCTFMPRPDTPSEDVFKVLKDAASMLEKYLPERK